MKNLKVGDEVYFYIGGDVERKYGKLTEIQKFKTYLDVNNGSSKEFEFKQYVISDEKGNKFYSAFTHHLYNSDTRTNCRKRH